MIKWFPIRIVKEFGVNDIRYNATFTFIGFELRLDINFSSLRDSFLIKGRYLMAILENSPFFFNFNHL